MTENLREGHFFRVLKNKATDTWDRLSFWTKARDVEFDDGRNLEERLPFDFAIDNSGNYGYKKKGADTVTPFRNPVGNATAEHVLQGKVFSNAYSDNVTGTMPNKGDLYITLNPNETSSFNAGYYSGGFVAAAANTDTYTFGNTDGSTVDMGKSNLNRYVNAQNVYTSGYNLGYSLGRDAGTNEGSSIGQNQILNNPSQYGLWRIMKIYTFWGDGDSYNTTNIEWFDNQRPTGYMYDGQTALPIPPPIAQEGVTHTARTNAFTHGLDPVPPNLFYSYNDTNCIKITNLNDTFGNLALELTTRNFLLIPGRYNNDDFLWQGTGFDPNSMINFSKYMEYDPVECALWVSYFIGISGTNVGYPESPTGVTWFRPPFSIYVIF